MLKILFFNLIIARNIKKIFKTAAVFIITIKKRVSILKHRANNAAINNENKKTNNKNIIKIIRIKIKIAIQIIIQEIKIASILLLTPKS
jgi:hypothetical protein